MTITSSTPSMDIDFYAKELMDDPYETYEALRTAGAAVYLPQHDAYVLSRYADVRSGLENWQAFSSGSGVSLNDYTNSTIKNTTLASDPPNHTRLRGVLSERLSPRALRSMREPIETRALALVEELLERDSLDAVTDIAQAMPLSIVPDFLGWPAEIRGKLLAWAGAAFDTMGPMNARTESTVDTRREFVEYAMGLASKGEAPHGSVAADVLAARDRGELSWDEAHALLLDYLLPSVDTTVSAIGSAILLFGRNPEQWDAVRNDPGKIPNAFNEIVRMETPVRAFSRLTTREVTLEDTTIPAQTRVLMCYASANRDERHWHKAASFDVNRDASSHLAFGYGIHSCAGQGLARLETQAVMKALAARVERFEVGEPVQAVNNVIRAIGSLPVTLHPAS